MTTNKACWLISALILILAIFASSAEAREDATCEQISGLAETVMRARQDGVAMSDMMKTSQNKLIRQIIINAYETPRYSMPRNQHREVADFRDEWHLACVKSES